MSYVGLCNSAASIQDLQPNEDLKVQVDGQGHPFFKGDASIDLVFAPRFTPSRIPLFNQRWSIPLPLLEARPEFPGAPQYGARWNHVGKIAEYSLSFYNGFDHLPLFQLTPRFEVQRFYPQLRMYGGDAAIPLGPVTVKSEAAYFTSTNPQSDNYILYVLQVERQSGEWIFVGGVARAAWLGGAIEGGSIDIVALMQPPQKNQVAMMASNRGFVVDH